MSQFYGDTFDPERMTWILDDDTFETFIANLESAHEVVFDLETTGLNEYAVFGGVSNGGVPAKIVLASFTLPQSEDDRDPTTWILPLYHPESPFRNREVELITRVADTIEDFRKPIYNQNIKFDLRWIYARTGRELSRLIVWDSLISSHLLDETRTARLKTRAAETFNIEEWDDFDLSTPGAALTVPLFQLGAYAARDTYWVWKLTLVHREVMFQTPDSSDPITPDETQDARLGQLAQWVDIPKVATLTRTEVRGILLDLEMTHEMIRKAEEVRDTKSEELQELVPVDGEVSWAPTSKWFRSWAEGAVEEGLLRVSAMTPSGAAKWDKGVLKRLSRNGFDTATSLLELREANKQLEFLHSWLGKVNPKTGRIHSTYNVGRTSTGRLSSSDPNMQQVSYALKPCFKASPGHVIIDFDYSQIEMRVAAFISRSETLREAFQEGKDTHSMMASAITGKPLSEITKDERQSGKSANFGLLFGMSPYGFMNYAETVYGVIFTEEEALEAYEAYFELWDGLRQWHDDMRQKVRRDGQVTSPIGRVRRLPGIWGYDPEEAERAAINSPVQGLASDIMQIASASIDGFNTPGVPGAAIIGTVHDSIMVETSEDQWQAVRDGCTERMVKAPSFLTRFGCNFDVPLVADSTVGTRWGISDIAE